MPRQPPRLLLLLALLAVSACSAPRRQLALRATKPGWDRTFAAEEAIQRVRAVPAALSPGLPERRIGKPGWGRSAL